MRCFQYLSSTYNLSRYIFYIRQWCPFVLRFSYCFYLMKWKPNVFLCFCLFVYSFLMTITDKYKTWEKKKNKKTHIPNTLCEHKRMSISCFISPCAQFFTLHSTRSLLYSWINYPLNMYMQNTFRSTEKSGYDQHPFTTLSSKKTWKMTETVMMTTTVDNGRKEFLQMLFIVSKHSAANEPLSLCILYLRFKITMEEFFFQYLFGLVNTRRRKRKKRNGKNNGNSNYFEYFSDPFETYGKILQALYTQ